MDKMMVRGAWVLMAVVGSLTAWKISQTPEVDPRFASLEKELTQDPRIPRMPAPPSIPMVQRGDRLLAEGRPASSLAYVVFPIMIGEPIEHGKMDVFVLPFPVLKSAKADQDGSTITWTLQDAPKENLQDWQTQKPATPAGFIIKRKADGKDEEKIAEVGPDVRSYTDLSAEPRQTYRYRVFVTGEETKRSSYPPEKETVTKGLEKSAEAKAPSNARVKLIGGDKSQAVLRVEMYDRAQKKWIAKTVMAAPGRVIGTSGWTLKGLRFDNFTLVADVTDDEGVERVLNTK